MPCRTENMDLLFKKPNEPKGEEENDKLKKEQMDHHLKELSFLRGSLCAICRQLEEMGICEEVLLKSTKDGEVDLVTWYNTHKNNDASRLLKKLSEFSLDEIKLIKSIFK